MVKFTNQDLCAAMNNKDNIRNVSVIAHIGHGKSTLTNSIVAYTNNNEPGADEAKSSTIKSTGISLYHKMAGSDLKGFKEEKSEGEKPKGQEYLINLIDSPGHIDFSSEVTAALRVTDGALVVVDCIEGVRMQTETVLRQALDESIRPVLTVNKMDRCFLELKLDGETAYQTLKKVINEANAVISAHEHPLLGDVRFYPNKGTVAFSAGLHSWAFTLTKFARKCAVKFKEDESKMMEKLWGDNFYDSDTKEWTTHDTGSPSCKRGFVMFCYEPIKQIIQMCMENTKDKLSSFMKQYGVSLTKQDKKLNLEALMKHVLKTWLPAGKALLEMMIFRLPSPAAAQGYRFGNLYEDRMEERYSKAFQECDPDGPLILYVSKMIPSPEQAGRFFAFGRVFAGKVSTNMEVRIMGPNFVFDSENDHDLYEKRVHSTCIWMRDNFVTVQNVPCGNIVALTGLDEAITKSATLTNVYEVNAHPIRAMKFSVSPVVRYGVQCKDRNNLPKLQKGLQLLDKSDLMVVCSIEEHGKAIIAGPGVHHLVNCLKDLQNKFMVDVPMFINGPVVLCRETVIEKDSCIVKARSWNKKNSLSMKAMPLGDINMGKVGEVLATGNMLVNSCNVNNLSEVQDLIDFGFHIASKEGVLANENMENIRFNICDAMLSNSRYPGADEIIPTTKKAMYGSQLAAKPRLLKPYYLVEIQSTESELPQISRELNNLEGKVLEEKAGTLFHNIQAYLPVDASFELSNRLGKHCQCVFHGWYLLDFDPLNPNSPAGALVATIRDMKGLDKKFPEVDDFGEMI